MNSAERLHLQKLINANNVEDQTPVIRKLKHSKQIRQEIDRLTNLRKENANLYLTAPDEFDKLCMSKCNFLFKNYTDIFHRVKKNEADHARSTNFQQLTGKQIIRHEGETRIRLLPYQLQRSEHNSV